jgi:hypothetical protein
VLNDKRKPIGYLDIPVLKKKFENGRADPEEQLCKSGSVKPAHTG